MADVRTVNAYCANCNGERSHDLLSCEESEWKDRDINGGVSGHGIEKGEILRCRGCEHLNMRHTSLWHEEGDEASDPPAVAIYPLRQFRPLPDWIADLYLEEMDGDVDLSKISSLLHEVYRAMRANAPNLAAMGIRAIVEQIMIHKMGDQGSFKNNVTRFVSEGTIVQNKKWR